VLILIEKKALRDRISLILRLQLWSQSTELASTYEAILDVVTPN